MEIFLPDADCIRHGTRRMRDVTAARCSRRREIAIGS